MTTHSLKTWPEYFQAVVDRKKTFEVRKNDRDYQVGDELLLHEWDPYTNKYTGRGYVTTIGYILKGGNFGIDHDVVIIALTEGERCSFLCTN